DKYNALPDNSIETKQHRLWMPTKEHASASVDGISRHYRKAIGIEYNIYHTMAKRMAVVPEELATTYFSKTSDAGLHDIESQIENLLRASSYSDDAKAKLLSQLILKYRHMVSEPKPPVRVSIEEEIRKRATLSYGINELWQCDLVDLKHLGKHNNGFRYLLTVIDVFSKCARVSALKMKTAEAVKNAFENLFQQAKPKNIQTDKGGEFYNSQLKSLFERYSINHYSAEGDHKASVVERISKANKSFRRGYLPVWSDEIFRVSKVYSSHPTTFELLQDLKSEAIKGRFYAEELQKISKRSDDYWRIEKVLKTKGIEKERVLRKVAGV
ncbi:uncharacterized transposon-derived protein F54H12.3, partial [Trichonephila clavipes]